MEGSQHREVAEEESLGSVEVVAAVEVVVGRDRSNPLVLSLSRYYAANLPGSSFP